MLFLLFLVLVVLLASSVVLVHRSNAVIRTLVERNSFLLLLAAAAFFKALVLLLPKLSVPFRAFLLFHSFLFTLHFRVVLGVFVHQPRTFALPHYYYLLLIKLLHF